MFSLIGGGRNTLAIECNSVVFLPTDTLHESTILRGHVDLTLKRNSHLKLSISLIGTAEVKAAEHPSEHQEVLNKEISIEEPDELPVGDHVFQFELEIPNRSPASIEVQGGKVAYVLKATAKGLGSLGYDLTQEKSLSVVWMAGGGESALPSGIERHITEDHPELHKWMLSLWSPAVTIGGILSISWSFQARLVGSTVLSMHVTLKQTTVSRSIADPNKQISVSTHDWALATTEDLDKEDLKVWYRTHSGSSRCPPLPLRIKIEGHVGGPRSITSVIDDVPDNVELIRLPMHDYMRPSTHKEDTSPVRVSHEIVLRTVYRNKHGKGRAHSVSLPLHLASCSCMVATLTLPTYSKKERKSDSIRNGLWCVCEESMAELVSEHKQAIESFAERCDLPGSLRGSLSEDPMPRVPIELSKIPSRPDSAPPPFELSAPEPSRSQSQPISGVRWQQ